MKEEVVPFVQKCFFSKMVIAIPLLRPPASSSSPPLCGRFVFFSLKCKTGALLFGKGDFARAVLVPYSTKLAWQVRKVIRVGCETGLLWNGNIECEAGALLFLWNARRALCLLNAFVKKMLMQRKNHLLRRCFFWRVQSASGLLHYAQSFIVVIGAHSPNSQTRNHWEEILSLTPQHCNFAVKTYLEADLLVLLA